MLKTPVAFIIFNRPERTARVFAEIAKARPQKLLIVADGPRHADERELCEATRTIVDRVDWDCDVERNFSEVNLGCKRRVSSGLDWVFEQAEEVIIVEDDCLPHPTFFQFCEEMLARFRDDERVGMICGSSFQSGRRSLPYSYYFGLHITVWGWASWRRAWRNYDVDMRTWPEFRDSPWLTELLQNPIAEKNWREIYEGSYQGEFDTWDWQLFFSWWSRNMLAAIPNRNLVTNIGFGDAASHTLDTLPTMANVALEAMQFPLKHPPLVELDREADNLAFRRIYPWIVENQNYYWQLRHKVVAKLPGPFREGVRRLRNKAQNLTSRNRTSVV